MKTKVKTEKKKILIIEDESDIVTILSFRLKKAGYEILKANNGKDGLSRARAEMPDLIILDLMLPELPGEEVCKQLREEDDPKLSKTPIIMVTAKIGDADRIIGKSIGANSYITKPFDVEEIISEIHKHLPVS